MFNILIVEDDSELRELFYTILKEDGYNVFLATNGEEALDVVEEIYVHLIISDVMMPRMNGYDLTKVLRESGYTMPILMITAKGSLLDKQEGFRVGTDDYLVKPVDVNEILWRVKALLRRAGITKSDVYNFGDTSLNVSQMIITSEGISQELPQKEFSLLYKLITSENKIFTRRQLIDEIWGIDTEVDPHTLEVHISRLRSKFKDNKDFKIVTVRGIGYKVVKG